MGSLSASSGARPCRNACRPTFSDVGGSFESFPELELIGNRLGKSITDALYKGDHVLVGGATRQLQIRARERQVQEREGREVLHLLEGARQFRPAIKPGGGSSASVHGGAGAAFGRRSVLKWTRPVALRLRPEAFSICPVFLPISKQFRRGSRKAWSMLPSADYESSGIKRRFRPRGRPQAFLPFRAEGTPPLSRTQFVRPEEKGRGHDFKAYLPLPALPDRKATDQ